MKPISYLGAVTLCNWYFLGVVCALLLFVNVSAGYADANGDFIPELLRVNVSCSRVVPGGKFNMTFYWRNAGDRPSLTNMLVCVHIRQSDTGLFNPDGGCWFNYYSANYKGGLKPLPFQGDYWPRIPTTKWVPGKTIIEGPFSLSVPSDSPDGEYKILVSLLDRGGRISLGPINSGMVSSTEGNTSYKVGVLRVSRTGGDIEPVCWSYAEDIEEPDRIPAPSLVSDIKATKPADSFPSRCGDVVTVGDEHFKVGLDKAEGYALAYVKVGDTTFESSAMFPAFTVYDKSGRRLMLAPNDSRWKVDFTGNRRDARVRYSMDGFETEVRYRLTDGGITAKVTPLKEETYKALLISGGGSIVNVPADRINAQSSAFILVPRAGGNLIKFPSYTQQVISTSWQSWAYSASFFGIGYNGRGLIIRCPQYGATWSYGSMNVNGDFSLFGDIAEAFRPGSRGFDMPRPERHIDIQFVPVGDVNGDGKFDWVDIGVKYRTSYIGKTVDPDKRLRESIFGKIEMAEPFDNIQNYSELIKQIKAIDFAPQTWWLIGAHTPPGYRFECPAYAAAPDPCHNGPGGYDYFAFKKEAEDAGARVGCHELFQDVGVNQTDYCEIPLKMDETGIPKATWGGFSDGRSAWTYAKALNAILADGSFYKDIDEHFRAWDVRPGDTWHWDCLSAMCGQQDYSLEHPATNGTDYRCGIEIAKYIKKVKGVHFTSEGLQEGMSEYLDMSWGAGINWSKPAEFENAEWIPLTPVIFQGMTYYAFTWHPAMSLLVGGKPAYERSVLVRDELVKMCFNHDVFWQKIADRTVNNMIKTENGWRVEYSQGGHLTVDLADFTPAMTFILEIDGQRYTPQNPPPTVWGVNAKLADGKYELSYPSNRAAKK